MNLQSLPFVLVAAAIAAPAAADPWADTVVQYTPGAGVPSVFGSDPPELFDNELAALGEPSRTSGGSVVSPYSSAFTPDEVVSLGDGGSLTVRFDEPVTDDPLNPYGIDLLVFGNAFFTIGGGFPFADDAPVTGVASEAALVELSVDGLTWVTAPGVTPDGLYPTNGYADSVGFFPAGPGGVLTDFTLPVDPAFDPVGKTSAEVYAGYAGSGGGAGIDLADYGLSAIQYVRITNPTGSGFTPEVDGLADVRAVPEPSTILLLTLAAVLPATRVR